MNIRTIQYTLAIVKLLKAWTIGNQNDIIKKNSSLAEEKRSPWFYFVGMIVLAKQNMFHIGFGLWLIDKDIAFSLVLCGSVWLEWVCQVNLSETTAAVRQKLNK